MAESTYSLSFNGSDAYVAAGYSGTSGALSLSFWFKPSRNYNYEVWVDTTGSADLRIYTTAAGEIHADCNGQDLNMSGVAPGVWHHVAFTRSGAGTNRLYLDGTEASSTTSNSPGGSPTEIRFGRSSDGFSCQGLMDDIAVFHSALSGANVAALAAGTSFPQGFSPAGVWHFEEGSGSTISDSSGNGNTGTANGGYTWSSDVPSQLTGGASDTGSGAATITFTAAGAGKADATGSGASTATFTASGAGKADATGSGSATITISASGTGVADATGSGSATATFTVTGVGKSDATGSGAATATFTAAGAGVADATASGASTMTFTVAGVGIADAAGSGAATLTFTATGAGEATATGSGAATAKFTAAGSGAADAVGSGSASFSFTVVGVPATDTGSGSATISFSVAGVGIADAVGRGAATITFTVTGVGSFDSITSATYPINSRADEESSYSTSAYAAIQFGQRSQDSESFPRG